MERHELRVTGMTCASCERIVEDEVTRLAGVASVSADSGANRVTVEGDAEAGDAARAVIADIGYGVER
ncbi:heavy-metal-associated domain-containing protein [Halorussus sp. AFM4]|uniref:heavy-metal-associated domain-containing protein n=1 Tax=Halorussus sp. AFM4 TaxID=3421651 RepID=UPI003EBF38EE